MLIDVDTGFDVELAELLFAAVGAGKEDDCEFCEVETAGVELEILSELEFALAEIGGEEIVAGDDIPPAILPAVLDMVFGSWWKNESKSDSCAPLFESARVKACLAATSPINSPKSERHSAAIGVINERFLLYLF